MTEIELKIKAFRNARQLAKMFPDRFVLKARFIGQHFVWACFEYRDYSVEPETHSESHKGLVAHGWNITLGRVHDYRGGIYEFLDMSC